MKVTTKGQVTIPLDVRKKVGIMPGTEVAFVESKGRVYLKVVAGPDRGKALIERMAGQGNVNMSTDEILSLTRGTD